MNGISFTSPLIQAHSSIVLSKHFDYRRGNQYQWWAGLAAVAEKFGEINRALRPTERKNILNEYLFYFIYRWRVKLSRDYKEDSRSRQIVESQGVHSIRLKYIWNHEIEEAQILISGGNKRRYEEEEVIRNWLTSSHPFITPRWREERGENRSRKKNRDHTNWV